MVVEVVPDDGSGGTVVVVEATVVVVWGPQSLVATVCTLSCAARVQVVFLCSSHAALAVPQDCPGTSRRFAKSKFWCMSDS